MTAVALPEFPIWSAGWFAAALVAFAVGYAAGLLHFRSLRSVARRLIGGDWTAVGLQLLRLALLGGLLLLLVQGGAHLLLAGTAGVLLARHRVLTTSETGHE